MVSFRVLASDEYTPINLMRQIGLPDSPTIVDVRIADDISPDDRTIPTAIFHNFRDIDGLLDRLSGRKAVVVCHKGLKLSQGTASLVRVNASTAEVLTGGFVGWAEAELPTLPIGLIPQSSRWVTSQRPKIDRIACPWLIKRFIDRDAKVIFVPRADVAAVADRFGAVPFDTPDAPYNHRGENCSFDAFLDAFGLRTDALNRMADVIRAADTDNHNNAPQAAGLLSLSVGVSKMYRDDNAMLDAGLTLYDALYRWARDGFDEGHAE